MVWSDHPKYIGTAWGGQPQGWMAVTWGALPGRSHLSPEAGFGLLLDTGSLCSDSCPFSHLVLPHSYPQALVGTFPSVFCPAMENLPQVLQHMACGRYTPFLWSLSAARTAACKRRVWSGHLCPYQWLESLSPRLSGRGREHGHTVSGTHRVSAVPPNMNLEHF